MIKTGADTDTSCSATVSDLKFGPNSIFQSYERLKIDFYRPLNTLANVADISWRVNRYPKKGSTRFASCSAMVSDLKFGPSSCKDSTYPASLSSVSNSFFFFPSLSLYPLVRMELVVEFLQK